MSNIEVLIRREEDADQQEVLVLKDGRVAAYVIQPDEPIDDTWDLTESSYIGKTPGELIFTDPPWSEIADPEERADAEQYMGDRLFELELDQMMGDEQPKGVCKCGHARYQHLIDGDCSADNCKCKKYEEGG